MLERSFGCAALPGASTAHKYNFPRRYDMLGWAITFLVLALIAGVLGFTTIAGTAAGIAKILFFVFLIVFIISLFLGRRRPTV